jgi:hypothetical protein
VVQRAVVDPFHLAVGQGLGGFEILLIALTAAVGVKSNQIEHDDGSVGIFCDEVSNVCSSEVLHDGFSSFVHVVGLALDVGVRFGPPSPATVCVVPL